jgi:diguanylate cyclase (GGDEF)-like protein
VVKFKQQTIDGKVEDDGEKVTISKAEYENLVKQASYDGLTSLLNKARFEDQLMHDLSVARRHIKKGGDPDNMVLMYIDVNGLKHVNDTYGHEKGDNLLVRTADALYHFLHRESDTVARIGGDEFAAILPQTDMESARDVAARLQEGAKQMGVLISVGMASYQLSVTDPVNDGKYSRSLNEVIHELKSRADKAMYTNKSDTKQRTNTAQFYDRLYNSVSEKPRLPATAYVA